MQKLVPDSRTCATSLLKGLKILSLFSQEGREWGVTELSAALGAAKSTVSRIARTLEVEGFLVRDPRTERFHLGLRLWELGCVAINDSVGFPEKARPYLEEIVAATHESAQAAILDGFEIVYVDKLDAPRSIRPYISLGARFPAYCTATGRALLAYQPESVVQTLIKKGLRQYTDRTIVDGTRLREELKQVRNRGYAINRGQWRDDIGGIGTPVRDRTDSVVGALGVTIPLARFPKGVNSSIVRALLSAAERLSKDLGYIGESRSTKGMG